MKTPRRPSNAKARKAVRKTQAAGQKEKTGKVEPQGDQAAGSEQKEKEDREKKEKKEAEERRQERLRDIMKAETAMIVYSDRLRETVRHENELVNHRIHWLVLLNGLAFAGTGVLWGKDGGEWILLTLSVAGMLCSFSCFLALQGGRMALHRLNHLWDTLEGDVAGLAPISGRSQSHAAKAAEAEKGDLSGRDPVNPSQKSPDFGITYSRGEKFLLFVDRGRWTVAHPLTFIPPLMILVWIVVAGRIVIDMCNGDPKEREIASVTVDGVKVKVTHAPAVEGDKKQKTDAGTEDPPKSDPKPTTQTIPGSPDPTTGEKNQSVRPTGPEASKQIPIPNPPPGDS